MNDTFNGGWIFAFLIIAVIFGWGGGLGGNNAALAGYATIADVNSAINNQSTQQALSAIQLASNNNNYDTARLISDQNMTMMNQANTALLTAVNGFNAVSANIANGFSTVNQNIADLGYKMEKCCCDIKTQMLQDRLQDAQTVLGQQFTAISNAEQSQYILSQLGSFTPKASV